MACRAVAQSTFEKDDPGDSTWSSNGSNDANYDTEDRSLANIDRSHLAIGRLQADATVFRIPILQRRFAVARLRNDHLAGTRFALFLDNNHIAVGDVRFDHRIA